MRCIHSWVCVHVLCPLCARFFLNEKRPTFTSEIREEEPDLSGKQVTQKVAIKAGAEWREMDEARKAPYERMASDDKERYNREMAAAGGKDWQLTQLNTLLLFKNKITVLIRISSYLTI